MSQHGGHYSFVPVTFCEPVTYFGIIALHVCSTDKTYVACGFSIDFDAVVILFILTFGRFYESGRVLFSIGVWQTVSAIVPYFLVVRYLAKAGMSLWDQFRIICLFIGDAVFAEFPIYRLSFLFVHLVCSILFFYFPVAAFIGAYTFD